jgi:hypothetical protein
MEPVQNRFDSSLLPTDIPALPYNPVDPLIVPDASLMATASVPETQSISAGTNTTSEADGVP